MRFTTIAASFLLGVSAVIAAPTRAKFTGCDVSGIKLGQELLVDPKNSSNVLPAPATNEKLAKIVLGYGSQNYSCIGGVPTPNGAVATLYDISCPAKDNMDLAELLSPLFVQLDPNMQSAAIKLYSNFLNEQFITGVHYFKGDFTTPAFEFVDRTKFFGKVGGKISALPGSDAGKKPNAYGAVPSLKLDVRPGMGSTYSTVYRLHTAGGAAPATCNWTGQKQIPYAAQYWIYKSS